MHKEFAKYMKWGKTVEIPTTKEVFKLIEDMDKNKDSVKVVSMNNWNRYSLLKAWVRNYDHMEGFKERFDGNIDDCKIEMQSYEQEVKIVDVDPHDTICFITSDYETKFEVKDLSVISVNDMVVRVAFIDEYHFTFVDKIGMNLYGGCFHICQFAEICERDGIEVGRIGD